MTLGAERAYTIFRRQVLLAGSAVRRARALEACRSHYRQRYSGYTLFAGLLTNRLVPSLLIQPLLRAGSLGSTCTKTQSRFNLPTASIKLHLRSGSRRQPSKFPALLDTLQLLIERALNG